MFDLLARNAWAQQSSPPQQGGAGFLFMIVVFVLLMYLLIIRPQMKQAKAHRQLLESLAKGDEVATSGGLLGRIRDVGDNFILLEVAARVEVKVQKNTISQVLPKGSLKGL